MRRAQAGPGVPADVNIALYMAMVGPWQYQCGMAGYYPSPTHPGTARLRTPRRTDTPWTTRRLGPLGHAHMTSLDHPKEILGVNNAHQSEAHRYYRF